MPRPSSVSDGDAATASASFAAPTSVMRFPESPSVVTVVVLFPTASDGGDIRFRWFGSPREEAHDVRPAALNGLYERGEGGVVGHGREREREREREMRRRRRSSSCCCTSGATVTVGETSGARRRADGSKAYTSKG